MSYTNWAPQEPNWQGMESCLNLWPEYGWYFNDYLCGAGACFVCEKRHDLGEDGCP